MSSTISKKLESSINLHNARPAQPPMSPEFRRLREEAESELLATPVADCETFHTLRNGTRIRFRRFGLTLVCGSHIVYED